MKVVKKNEAREADDNVSAYNPDKVSDEICHLFFPPRFCEAEKDILSDLVGLDFSTILLPLECEVLKKAMSGRRVKKDLLLPIGEKIRRYLGI